MHTGSYVFMGTHTHTQAGADAHTCAHKQRVVLVWRLVPAAVPTLSLPLSASSSLLLLSPFSFCAPPESPPPTTASEKHTQTLNDVNTSTSQNTEGCVYFRHARPECMDSCLSPLPLSVSPSFPPLVHFLLPRGFLAAGAV